VVAEDKDRVDKGGLLYTLAGDGVDGYPLEDAYFSIDPQNGWITQHRVSLSINRNAIYFTK